ncbi:MAG: hypothetical protein VB085_02610 [Peptococcaceae bacterium]|nr:hypothetical protein [Peptococcaceae bacterium]
MPWVDTAIIILVLAGAYIGYCKGFIGCLKGIIGCVVGLVVAWLTKPLAMAWLQAQWGVETRLALFLRQAIPENIQELIKGVSGAADSLQELKDSLLSLPLPEEVAGYLHQALQGTGVQGAVNAENVVDSLMLSIAQTIVGAIVFLLIWWIVSFLVRWILGLFSGGDGFGLFGVVDGLLGMTFFTAVELGGLVLLSGALYPAALMANLSGNGPAYYTLILNSGLMRFMANLYQIKLLPLLG